MKIYPPYFLFFSSECCWKCQENQVVVALGVSGYNEEEDGCYRYNPAAEEVFLLSNISEMPDELKQEIVSRHRAYQLHFSKTVGSAYYANMCKCGANFGDWYLFSEPGGAFFPVSEAEATAVSYCKLPLNHPLEVTANWSEGPGDNLYRHGREIDA